MESRELRSVRPRIARTVRLATTRQNHDNDGLGKTSSTSEQKIVEKLPYDLN
jgi:hypothetical protein